MEIKNYAYAYASETLMTSQSSNMTKETKSLNEQFIHDSN